MAQLGMPGGREPGQLAQALERGRLAVGLDLDPRGVPDHRQVGVRAQNPRGHVLEPGGRRAVQQALELERSQDLGGVVHAAVPPAAASSRRFWSLRASRTPGPVGRSALRACSQYQPGCWPGMTSRPRAPAPRSSRRSAPARQRLRRRRGAFACRGRRGAVDSTTRRARRAIEREPLVVNRERLRHVEDLQPASCRRLQKSVSSEYTKNAGSR